MNVINFKQTLLDNGWVEYEGGTWIKKEWIDQNLPYDRMALTTKEAITRVLKNVKYKKPKNEDTETTGS